ncbi:aldo/keto reductase [Listeria aquatica]|uniref:Oxidoreductase, aldo/keto reductase family protein n=1 Tax=Listeria aquatica FSL S10-1188 TaxID=1265818 RepID=W7B7G2_9LIST|nr:aldo/keto reductase [Listeria aquatica]EUJ21832.1 oxidoreductase, aldo/keto reductase family protein [Listeria aquatica FSL S10-1188]
MEYKTLNNGLKVPVLGFGVFQITDQGEAEQAVLHALQTGYRLIDTAAVYLNEEAVGRAIQKSGIPRSEITLTTKLWITDASYDGAMRAFERSTKKLGTDYLDIFLIHQPYNDYYGAWRALTELYKAEKIKAIGVSNFSTGRLTDLILNHEVKPVLDQIELHPYRQQALQRDTAAHFDVSIEAWSPFNQGKDGIFEDAVLTEIAKKHGKTVPQVILRWQTQIGNMAIPKSTHLERIKENFAIFDFKLTEEELQQIASLDRAPNSAGPRENYQLVERLNGITLE